MKRRMMLRRKYDKYDNGVYILHTNGRLYTLSEWNTSEKANAVGVALKTDNCRFVISPEESTNRLAWSTVLTEVDIVTSEDYNVVKNDFDGIGNTRKIIEQLGEAAAPAAAYCRSVVFKHGKRGYLGAFGEWQEAINHKTEIESCMSLIGGYTFVIEGNDVYYWASTQATAAKTWSWLWRDSKYYDKGYDKTFLDRVRAFAPL